MPVCRGRSGSKSKHNWIKVNSHAFEGQTQHTARAHTLMNSDLSLLWNSRAINFNVPLQRPNYMHIHGVSTLISEIHLRRKRFSAHIAHFCPINYSIMIVKYSQPVNTIQLSILFSANLTRKCTHTRGPLKYTLLCLKKASFFNWFDWIHFKIATKTFLF